MLILRYSVTKHNLIILRFYLFVEHEVVQFTFYAGGWEIPGIREISKLGYAYRGTKSISTTVRFIFICVS